MSKRVRINEETELKLKALWKRAEQTANKQEAKALKDEYYKIWVSAKNQYAAQ